MTCLLQVYTSVHKVVWECKTLHLELSSHETLVMEAMIDLLKPFEKASIKLSSESRSTTGMLLPVFAQIKRQLLVKDSDKPIIKSVKQVMLADLDNRYKLPQEKKILHTASAMDPCFKSFAWISDEERSTVWTEGEEKVLFYNSQSTRPLSTAIKVKSEPIDDGYPAVPSGSTSSTTFPSLPLGVQLPTLPSLPSLPLGVQLPSLVPTAQI